MQDYDLVIVGPAAATCCQHRKPRTGGSRASTGAFGEYNAKFMVNQHVLRGSACITPPGHARRTSRNFYPPRARWPYTGLRLSR